MYFPRKRDNLRYLIQTFQCPIYLVALGADISGNWTLGSKVLPKTWLLFIPKNLHGFLRKKTCESQGFGMHQSFFVGQICNLENPGSWTGHKIIFTYIDPIKKINYSCTQIWFPRKIRVSSTGDLLKNRVTGGSAGLQICGQGLLGVGCLSILRLFGDEKIIFLPNGGEKWWCTMV